MQVTVNARQIQVLNYGSQFFGIINLSKPLLLVPASSNYRSSSRPKLVTLNYSAL